MLSQCTNRISHSRKKPETRSPYYLQYKIFEDRLKNYGLKWKTKTIRNKKQENKPVSLVGDSKEDYLTLVKQMLSKNEDINLFGDFQKNHDYDDEATHEKQQIHLQLLKARCRDNQSRTKSEYPKNRFAHHKKDQDTFSSATQNLMLDFPSRIKNGNSRIKSQNNTANLRTIKNIQRNPQKYVSFLGYKKDHRLMRLSKAREIL